MFRDSSAPVRFLGNVLIVVLLFALAVNITNYFYEHDKSEFLEFTQPPRILDTNFNPTYQFQSGDAIIIEYSVEKYEIGCYAEYQNTFVGPVSWQMPPRKSQFIGERGTISRNTVRLFAELPKTLPKGTYQVQLAVFPVCDGIPRDAFRMANPTPTIEVK